MSRSSVVGEMNVAVQTAAVQLGQAFGVTKDIVLLTCSITKVAQEAWLSAAGCSPKAHRACGRVTVAARSHLLSLK